MTAAHTADGPVWAGRAARRAAYFGARYGPEIWLRVSPGPIGALFAWTLPGSRARVRENLRLVLGRRSPVEEALDVTRTFAAYAHCLAESLARDRRRARAARRTVRGHEHLSGVLAEGRGAVIVTAHTGAWDAAAGLLRRDFAVDVTIVMQPERDARAGAWHDAVRARHGVQIVHVGGDPLESLRLLGHVRRGGVVAVQIDRAPPSGRTVKVDWFGGQLPVPLGPFVLAAAAAVPVIPLFARRVGFFDYELSVAPPIRLAWRPREVDVARAAARAAREMERFVRANPTQWFNFS